MDARNEHPLIASDIQLFSAVFTDHVCAFLQVFLDVTLPEPQNEPAHIRQFVIDFLVPLNIPLQLLLPVFLIWNQSVLPDVPDALWHARNHHQQKQRCGTG